LGNDIEMNDKIKWQQILGSHKNVGSMQISDIVFSLLIAAVVATN
jgi:hypothetical protein